MKKVVGILLSAALLSGCLGSAPVLPDRSVEVTENRLDNFKAPNGVMYNMRTYIVPFENPYYITVSPTVSIGSFENGNGIAARTALAYIKPRGCTSKPRRIADKDIFDATNNAWTIVISC